MMHPLRTIARRTMKGSLQLALILMCLTAVATDRSNIDPDTRPDDFVVLTEHIPGIQLQLKYATSDNFTGNVVTGYRGGQCLITKDAAEALKKVQSELSSMGLSLLVFDAYRPQHAVECFVEWAKTPNTDDAIRRRFFPKLRKSELFPKGYIADRSGHSRGSTIDLTICSIRKNGKVKPLNMGTPFDFFGEEAGIPYKDIPPQHRSNRLLLKQLMEKHGFRNYAVEWWHFTLNNEPYPDTYFNFSISKP
ncbi:MAG: M15 family metallopeptidase [Verrucomicrobiota bacterium]|jgi:D-alanyl-D-alanine dipeptidase